MRKLLHGGSGKKPYRPVAQVFLQEQLPLLVRSLEPALATAQP